jgi:hypothetical protein
VLDEPADRPPLAGRVTPLEEDRQPLALGLDPVLHLHELDLQALQLVLVLDRALDPRDVEALGPEELDQLARRVQVAELLAREHDLGEGIRGLGTPLEDFDQRLQPDSQRRGRGVGGHDPVVVAVAVAARREQRRGVGAGVHQEFLIIRVVRSWDRHGSPRGTAGCGVRDDARPSPGRSRRRNLKGAKGRSAPSARFSNLTRSSGDKKERGSCRSGGG